MCVEVPFFRWVLRVLPFTTLLTFVVTLYACYQDFVEQEPWDDCSKELCDISVYGGWTDKAHDIFVMGFVLLSIQLITLVDGRLALQKRAAPAYLHVACPCSTCCREPPEGDSDSSTEAGFCTFCICRRPFVTGSVIYHITAIMLIPMAVVPFWKHWIHFAFAVVVFCLIPVGGLIDVRLMEELGASRATIWWGNILSYTTWVGLLLWPVSTYFEWMAAIAPFVNFLAWPFHVTWLWELGDEKAGIVGLPVGVAQLEYYEAEG